jgi:DNA mismatch endonuclease (patch repair protein)
MADIWSKAKRSEVMARIRGRGNRTTEVRLAALFRAQGITGWRRQYPLPGRPDFAFPARRLAVFVDGCFWHGCPRHGTLPKGNARFWWEKLARNRARDREVNRELRRRGWRVIRLWEHELLPSAEARVVGRLRRSLGPTPVAASVDRGR